MTNNHDATELEIIVVEPAIKMANSSIIWLHGLGAQGSDFMAIIDQLGLPAKHKIRFLFPNAPIRPITVNNQMLMRAWYDIYSLDITAKEDINGLKQSEQLINNLIQQELNSGILSTNIMLAGFSQGGALSLYTGLRYAHPLAGVIALSCYLPLAHDAHNAVLTAANSKIPIFMAHGLFDPVVPYSVGRNSYEYLTKLTYNVQWESYPMQHTLCLQEISEIGHFIKKVLPYS